MFAPVLRGFEKILPARVYCGALQSVAARFARTSAPPVGADEDTQ
jgi:hypothetical protein